ncbi:hypothetical protein ACQKP8_27200, partial [Photobacterium alginatilyticum]|uniref:hypothetical protein n=1 Tax=Photobacterium alginatilyticum TaxID=1775171 RepID=UPI0040680152
VKNRKQEATNHFFVIIVILSDYGLTLGIRCATMNSPNPLNSEPKPPSVKRHLDAFVMLVLT